MVRLDSFHPTVLGAGPVGNCVVVPGPFRVEWTYRRSGSKVAPQRDGVCADHGVCAGQAYSSCPVFCFGTDQPSHLVDFLLENFSALTRVPSKSNVSVPANGGNGHRAAGNGGNGKTGQAAAPSDCRQDKPEARRDDDQVLVDRCRAGDDAAWEEIHARCHSHLVKQIRYTLGERARDANLVDEIAARVWFGLVADDGYLLERFQPDRGNGLGKYLAAIARFEVLRHQRGEFRRRRREQETQTARQSARDDRQLAEMTLDVQDFLPKLTPREKEFFYRVLLGNDNRNGEELQISAPNAWQLRHRIRRKLLAFLELE
jgi:DNA-directed RNA polymerase specialized sigma24 family protein